MLNKGQVKILESLSRESVIEKFKNPFISENSAIATNGYMALIYGRNFNDDYSTIKNYLNLEPNSYIEININRKELKDLLKNKKETITFFNTLDSFFIVDNLGNIIYEKSGCYREEKQVTLNIRYLRRVINFINKKDLNIKITSQIKQCIFESGEYRCVIMPIKLMRTAKYHMKDLKIKVNDILDLIAEKRGLLDHLPF